MISLTDSAKARLGVRAAAFVEQRASQWHVDQPALCPDGRQTQGVERTLRRIYGASSTIDRGETAYWQIPPTDLLVDS